MAMPYDAHLCDFTDITELLANHKSLTKNSVRHGIRTRKCWERQWPERHADETYF